MISQRFPLEEACQRHGAAIAFADGQRVVSYAELAGKVETQANTFLEHGIGKGDRVAWCSDNDYRTLVTFWSLFSIGAVACPMSHRFPVEESKAIVQRLGARWGFDQAKGKTPRCSTHYECAAPATITLSSGSTGDPKAVVHSLHGHVANAVGASSNMPLAVGDRWIWSLPTCHVSGLAILIRCAVSGATIYGMHGSDKLSGESLNHARITHLSVVAAQLRRLLREDSFPSSSLKAVLLGGSVVPLSLLKEAVRRGVPVHTTYGLTEMASQVATSHANPAQVTSGRVLPHREVKIEGTGEILVRGETLCLGYAVGGEIEPIVDSAGWFHTGDLGELDEHGELSVSGRMDNMFISGGENVYPETIERAMLDLPGVVEAIVVPRADDEFGSRPIAFVRAETYREADWTEALRAKLRSFEIPIAYLPFPNELLAGIKPSRAKLTAIANQRAS